MIDPGSTAVIDPGSTAVQHIITLHYRLDTFSRTLQVQTAEGEFSR